MLSNNCMLPHDREVPSQSEPMPSQDRRSSGSGYTSEVDIADEETWYRVLQEFDDANIYQTWSYAATMSGRRNVSRLLLKKNGEVVAAAQARIVKMPLLKLGIAYVRWGPLWQRHGAAPDTEVFRHAVRALRDEYVCRRGLTLRLFPILFDHSSPTLSAILAEEGLSAPDRETRERTILVDLTPSLDELHNGLARNWKRNLKTAKQNDLQIVEGSDDELFGRFIELYKQMVSRKGFAEPNDINQFRLMQPHLPDRFKMRIALCTSAGQICAGLIWSALGSTGIELFAATNETGLENKGSYLLRWRLLTHLKENHFVFYDLNGINPLINPGGYKFKRELGGNNGKDVYYLGRFDSYPNSTARACVTCADRLKTMRPSIGRIAKRVGNLSGLITTK